MQHTVKQSTRYITHVHIQAMMIKMNNDTNFMLKDNQEDIQARESMCQIKQYTTMNPYMQDDQNNHGTNQNHYAKRSKMSNRYNQHVNIPNKYSNEVQKR